MLQNTNRVLGFRLSAKDGSIGSVHDLSFDDWTWNIRYIVANTGGWLTGRLVLLSPVSLGSPDWQEKEISVSLTKDQMEKSPTIDADQTVSRKHETELHQYYGWPAYWTSYPLGGIGFMPVPAAAPVEPGEEAESKSDPHLRSVREVSGYHIQASDGGIGHVEDFLFDEKTWIIRYAVADTRNWLPGRKVLIAPAWIESFRWDERKAHVSMSRESIKQAPEYDHSIPIDRAYEERLHDYYGKSGYWS